MAEPNRFPVHATIWFEADSQEQADDDFIRWSDGLNDYSFGEVSVAHYEPGAKPIVWPEDEDEDED